VFQDRNSDPKTIADLLNNAGKQGWELAAVTGTPINVILVLKK